MIELCKIVTAEQAIEAYVERFGGWPKFLMAGASEKKVIFEVRKSLRTGVEIEADYDDADY